MNQNETRRRFGYRRWLVLALIVVELVLVSIFPPLRPPTELAAEALTDPVTLPILGSVSFTNTILTVLIADVLLISVAVAVSRAYRSGISVPKGVAGAFEMIVEALYNLVESVSGRWAKTFFPIVGTILLLVLTVNLMKLFPGMESIGWLHEVHEGEGYAARQAGPVWILEPIDEEAPHLTEGEGEEEPHLYNVIPFLRPASTDLNFTLSVALIAMIFVQFIGFRAGGPGYLSKFFNLGGFIRMWAAEKLGAFDILMPLINIFVGILELIAEFARIISFTFRLFGSMFAGAILLGVTGALFMVLQLPFLFLEIFFGAVQAFVFAMLTLVFLQMATQTHGGEHAEEHAEAH